MALKGYSQDEVFAILDESEKERKRRHKLAKITEVVNAHRLNEVKTFLAKQYAIAWRVRYGFERDGTVTYTLLLSPEGCNALLRLEVEALKDLISMPG